MFDVQEYLRKEQVRIEETRSFTKVMCEDRQEVIEELALLAARLQSIQDKLKDE